MPGLGASLGRGGATNFQQDFQMADCVWIQGSSLMEAHPVGSRWALKARERGAKIIHVAPHFSRTSALADTHVPIRAGSDIAFLGGLIRHIIETESYFKDYVVHYTNASMLLRSRRSTSAGWARSVRRCAAVARAGCSALPAGRC